MENEAIITDLGIINGRDAIYLDLVEHKNNVLTFSGEINSELIGKNITGSNDFIKYTLSFFETIFYKCWELDYYDNEKLLASSFDVVNDSKLIEEINLLENIRKNKKITENHKHYILATYDYIYEIVSSKYILRI
jgi:hypothetical protein